MEKYVIKNNGELKGEVEISGSKNAVLPIIVATILSDETIVLKNIPNVSDVNNLLSILETLGSKFTFEKEKHILTINNKNINPNIILDIEYVKKLRASYYLLGVLLGKYKYATVAMPGGCNIGSRPIDLHLKGFELLGAKLNLDDGNILAQANELKGCKIYLDFPSVGATINLIFASIFAKGTTLLMNAAKEPHIADVISFLNSMGANISQTNDEIVIKGVDSLHSSTYSVIPDQIEAGTFLIAGAITRSNILVKNIIPCHMNCITSKLIEIGCDIKYIDNNILINSKNKKFKPINIYTSPYPGFPTDMQPQMASLLGTINGISIIQENIFENRFLYVDEFSRMGANMKVSNNTNIITGVKCYKGTSIYATDLRAGAAMVLAGLVAKNTTTVNDIQYIKRGYDSFDKKLNTLGANIIEKK